MRIRSFCISSKINLDKLDNTLKAGKIKAQRLNDLIIQDDNIFFFGSGTIVTWGLTKAQNDALIKSTRPFALDSIKNIDHDEFSLAQGNGFKLAPHGYFNVDVMELDERDFNNTETKTAIAYALSQSVKLQYFERKIDEFTQEYGHLIEQLAHKGKVKRSSKQISKIIGKLFMIKSSVNLTSAYLNPPPFIWQHVNLEDYYQKTCQYMDISERVIAINQKMDVLNEMFDMLNAQLHHQHGSFLEIVIIILLIGEVVIGLLPFLLQPHS